MQMQIHIEVDWDRFLARIDQYNIFTQAKKRDDLVKNIDEALKAYNEAPTTKRLMKNGSSNIYKFYFESPAPYANNILTAR